MRAAGRRRHARWLERCLALIVLSSAGACASTGAVPSPFPRPAPSPRVPVDRGAPAADLLAPRSAIVDTALSMRGVPYRNGGADPSGFDCSGLVAFSFASHGVWVPRTVAEQFAAGDPVDSAALQPGDLVFFETISRGPSHVGIVISGQEFVHAPNASGVVRLEALAAPYWASRFIGARRIRQ
jgi:cell wall-associated NlpC family hydrolase